MPCLAAHQPGYQSKVGAFGYSSRFSIGIIIPRGDRSGTPDKAIISCSPLSLAQHGKPEAVLVLRTSRVVAPSGIGRDDRAFHIYGESGCSFSRRKPRRRSGSSNSNTQESGPKPCQFPFRPSWSELGSSLIPALASAESPSVASVG